MPWRLLERRKGGGGDHVNLMLIGRHTRQHPPRVPELPLRGSGSVGRNWPEAADSQLREVGCTRTAARVCSRFGRSRSRGETGGVSPSGSAAQEPFLQFAQFGRRGGAELVAEALAQLFVDA
jgi:hypothetical protein